MKGIYWFQRLFTVLLFSLMACSASAGVKGIYLTQSTAELSKRMDYLITNAKAHGIDTFVVDVWRPSQRYANNIKKMRDAGIKYVARVVIFPHGGSREQVRDKAIWQKRWQLIEYALNNGAAEIQLDYIRYSHKVSASDTNAEDIFKVIQFYKDKMKSYKARLQIDVFGIAAHSPSRHIGQDVAMFATVVDAINPMVYPSHYEPFPFHSHHPYETVYQSLNKLKNHLKEFDNKHVHAYIEMYNYRLPMNWTKRVDYVIQQIKAAEDAGVQGWYAWSAQNKYAVLFDALKTLKK